MIKKIALKFIFVLSCSLISLLVLCEIRLIIKARQPHADVVLILSKIYKTQNNFLLVN